MLYYNRIMENKLKLFIAGAKKIAKIKELTQTDIATGTDSKQGTISSYFRGRTRMPKDMVEKTTTFLDVPYEEILEVGREQFQSRPPKELRDSIRDVLVEEKILPIKYDAKINKAHHQIIDQFENSNLALQINVHLLELEKIDPDELSEINEIIKLKLAKHRKNPQIEDGPPYG